MASHPDFICIGAQKAATTWLYQSLKARPDIFLPVIKELHYFSQLHAQHPHIYGPTHRKSQIGDCVHYFQRLVKTLPPVQRASKLKQLEHIDADTIDDDWYTG
ncbi:unnamed protein product, partial [Laminaria digitata]